MYNYELIDSMDCDITSLVQIVLDIIIAQKFKNLKGVIEKAKVAIQDYKIYPKIKMKINTWGIFKRPMKKYKIKKEKYGILTKITDYKYIQYHLNDKPQYDICKIYKCKENNKYYHEFIPLHN